LYFEGAEMTLNIRHLTNAARHQWLTPVIYSGGRDQEDCGSKQAQANSWRDSILKIPDTKRAGGVVQGVGPTTAKTTTTTTNNGAG
jgi:hypothetical protein